VTFRDDKKGKVLGTDVIKVNDCFTLNDVALVDRLRYNLLSVSQLCDADLSVFFRKSNLHVLDSSDKRVCGISRIGNVFQADFSSAWWWTGCNPVLIWMVLVGSSVSICMALASSTAFKALDEGGLARLGDAYGSRRLISLNSIAAIVAAANSMLSYS
jgi:hypothetical protein